MSVVVDWFLENWLALLAGLVFLLLIFKQRVFNLYYRVVNKFRRKREIKMPTRSFDEVLKDSENILNTEDKKSVELVKESLKKTEQEIKGIDENVDRINHQLLVFQKSRKKIMENEAVHSATLGGVARIGSEKK